MQNIVTKPQDRITPTTCTTCGGSGSVVAKDASGKEVQSACPACGKQSSGLRTK